MKVLQVAKTSEGANWAFKQAQCLANEGVEIVTILPDNKGIVAKEYLKNNMQVRVADVSLPVSKPWLFWNRKKLINQIINEEQPDIIHIHFVTNIIMFRLALKKSKVPRLFQVPGPLHLESKFFKKLDIKTANDLDYWAPSCIRSQKIYENEGVNSNKNFLAYYGGAGGKTIEEFEENSNILHKQFDIPDNNILIGMVSYFYKPKWYLGQKRGIKGHEDFIDAIEILNKKFDNITAVIIGGPWDNSYKYEEKVKQYAQKKGLKNIIFTGFRNDIKKIYKELNIAVHPSHSENLGGAAESLAAGVPTIATNIGGFPDIVINDKTGYLCEPKNPDSLAKEIEKMIVDKDKTLQMAKEGKKMVKDLLDINNTATRVLEIYKMMLEN